MFEHNCTLLDAYIPIEYQHVDSGICIYVRRKIVKNCLISQKHPMALQYFKSNHLRRQEKIRHLSNYPLMIHPFSLFTLFWECAYFVVYTLIALILCVTLIDRENIVGVYLLYIKRCLDIFIFLDIMKNFITGYYNKEKYGTVMRPATVFKQYLTTYFFCDFLPVIPTFVVLVDYASSNSKLFKTIYKITRICNVLRIVRVQRCCHALNLWRQYFKLSTNVSGIGIVVYRYVIIIVWLYGVLLYIDIFIETFIISKSSKATGTLMIFLAYTRLLLNASYGLDRSYHPVDIGTAVFFIVAAYALHLYLNCQILQAYKSFTHARNENDSLLEHFKAYVEYKGLPLSVRKIFFKFFKFKYENQFFNEIKINELLSRNLREQIQVQVSKDYVKKVEFLKQIPQDVLVQLVSRLKSEVYLTNDTIVVAGVPGNCMYFVHYGTVAVYTPSGKEWCHLNDGAHFGEIALIFNEPRNASVVAVTPCELFVLQRSDFNEIIDLYPEFKNEVINLANNRLTQTKNDNNN